MNIPEITLLDEKLFKQQGKALSNISIELESKEYLAHTFEIDNKKIIFRKAKITPTKTGQFVTIWKRNSKGITAPFNLLDDFESIIIFVKQDELIGAFIFPKAILHQKKIISDENKDGKRGIRVYPPWDTPSSKQAIKTQEWQIGHFVHLNKS